MHTIVITGGHHNSALVVAKELIKRGHNIAWIGHRHSSRGDKGDSAEYLEVKAAGISFNNLNAAKLLSDPRELARFPLGIIQSLILLKRVKPVAILSFGGYLGGTVALAGKCLGIPIYLHEQTVSAGRANKLIGKLAKKVYLTWSQSTRFFAKAKIKVVGLPLRPSILTTRPQQLFTRRRPTLLVMGGKQGAHAINQFIFTHLPDLLTHFNIVHQTGTSSLTRDYAHALSLQNSLGSLANSYLPMGYIIEGAIDDYLHSSDLYLGRSGAHICYELALIGLPCILVPLMISRDAEQHQNAEILVQAKLGLIISQDSLTLPHFMSKVNELHSLKAKSLGLKKDATTLLVDDFLTELK